MKWFLVWVAIGLAAGASAETPFQFSAPGLRAPDDPHVNGVRFAVITAKNRSVRGIDLGLISSSKTGDLTGLRWVLGVGHLSGDLRGCAASVVNLHRGRDRGLNAAFFNRVHTMANGANVGVLNLVDDFSMVDVGGLNLSERSKVQIGVINMTTRIEGVQLGFLNFADNGFLPIFPFFNFPGR
ncbi:MAG: phaC PHA synthase [bacterium]|nr:phaC PHA synthase [bacterium]